MHARILTMLVGLGLVEGQVPAEERTISVQVEELPKNGVRQLVQTGNTSDGAIPFTLSVGGSKAPKAGTEVRLTVGGDKFDAVHLASLPFDPLHPPSLSSYSRQYPHGRVFRVYLRYGEPAPSCQIGDDGRGKVSITYRKGHAPEIDHRPPAKC